MKNYIIVTAIASILFVPALFADTTGTGTTTSTGTVSTGVTSTGTTGTGVNCMTGVITTGSGNQAALLVAQQAFSTEVARLVSEKQAAYSGALALTGSLRTDAIQTMNTRFRTGFQKAIQALEAAKRANGSIHSEIRECRKEIKQEKHEEKKEQRQEIKSQIQALREKIQDLRQTRRNMRSHQ